MSNAPSVRDIHGAIAVSDARLEQYRDLAKAAIDWVLADRRADEHAQTLAQIEQATAASSPQRQAFADVFALACEHETECDLRLKAIAKKLVAELEQ